jgi:hypothetical protein
MPIKFDLSALLRRRSVKLVSASLIVIVAVTMVIFIARTWRSKPGSTDDAAPKTSATAPTPEPLGHLLVTVRPTGFDPQEIVQTKGEFLLAVDNRSGLKSVDLRLEAENGDRLRARSVPRERLDWREIVYFNPGVYLLKETNHPDWVCRIRITNNK